MKRLDRLVDTYSKRVVAAFFIYSCLVLLGLLWLIQISGLLSTLTSSDSITTLINQPVFRSSFLYHAYYAMTFLEGINRILYFFSEPFWGVYFWIVLSYILLFHTHGYFRKSQRIVLGIGLLYPFVYCTGIAVVLVYSFASAALIFAITALRLLSQIGLIIEIIIIILVIIYNSYSFIIDYLPLFKADELPFKQ